MALHTSAGASYVDRTGPLGSTGGVGLLSLRPFFFIGRGERIVASFSKALPLPVAYMIAGLILGHGQDGLAKARSGKAGPASLARVTLL